MGGRLRSVSQGKRMVGLPVAFAAPLLLGLSWVVAGDAGLAEVAREMLFRSGGAVGKPNVVTIRNLVGTSHCSSSVSIRT